MKTRDISASSRAALCALLAVGCAGSVNVGAADFKPLDYALTSPPAGLYRLDPRHAHVHVRIGHLGGLSRPIFRFNEVAAEYVWDPANPKATKVEARISPTSLDGNNFDTDMHLQGSMGLDSLKYDRITFVSREIDFTGVMTGPEEPHRGMKVVMKGDLTLHGVTKPITIDLIYHGFVEYRIWPKMGYSGHGKIKRSDFGMTAVPTAGDELEFDLALEFVRFQPSNIQTLTTPNGGRIAGPPR